MNPASDRSKLVKSDLQNMTLMSTLGAIISAINDVSRGRAYNPLSDKIVITSNPGMSLGSS